MVQAYILVQTEVGKAGTVTEAIRSMAETVGVENVTGPYDVVAKVQAETLDELGRLVVARVQELPGITRTLTCPVVNV
ncbi:Lrp/AsnC family transcriptional regulator [Aquipuribacter sp. SD81]|uniref:Lrp/AsnC family transcriptional regulator n=1 Tax=Aquipuribacter sp. SD81 TaxID=3127703 RepID=UPI003016BC6B